MTPQLIERFMAKIAKTDSCWFWTAASSCKDSDFDAYGIFRVSGSQRKAHRVAWEIFRGPIPAGHYVTHSCRYRLCVNPAHLLVTDSNNPYGNTGYYVRRLNPKYAIKHAEGGEYVGQGPVGEPTRSPEDSTDFS